MNTYDNPPVYVGDFRCTCYASWHGITAKPPCPIHPHGLPGWPTIQPGVTVTCYESEEMPAYDGPTEEFTLTLGVVSGYHVSKIKHPKLTIQAFLDTWHQVDSIRNEPMLPVRASIQRVGYPGGEEDVIVAKGTRNPYWAKDPVEWRERVLLHVREMKKAYEQRTTQVTFSPTHLVYYRDESP